MSPLFGALGIGDSALRAAQIAIQVTGKNIANAGDENYTRQRATEEDVTNRVSIGIANASAATLGSNTRTIPSQGGGTLTIEGFFSSLKSGKANDLSTNAENALRIVDTAIDQVTSTRAFLGAFQKQTLESNIASLTIASENLSASLSDIRDLDFAKETSELTRTQILFQAGTAVLGQANQLPQAVLALLR